MMMDLQRLREEQQQKALLVRWQDDDDFTEPELIAGADVGFTQNGGITRAAIVVLRFPSLELVEYQLAEIETTLPYIPGLLSFRELPALLVAWEKLRNRPQMMFVDGHGVSHPRRLGIASHFGLLAEVPTIGVAKQRLCGQSAPLAEEQDARQPLRDKQQQIGWVWRSKWRCQPLYLSPGHRVSMQSALRWTQRCMQGYRLPEPTRWADAFASRRPALTRWLSNLSAEVQTD